MDVMQFQPNKKVMYIKCVLAIFWSLIFMLFFVIPMILFTNKLYVILPVVGFILLCSLEVLYIVLHFPTIRYEINSQYIINSEGLFWKKNRLTPLDKVTNVDVRQGPIDRLIGVGQIWVFTPSTGALIPECKLIGIDKPHDVRAIIVSFIGKAKLRPQEKQSSPESTLQEILTTLKSIESTLKIK